MIVADDSVLLREGVARLLEEAGSRWSGRPADARGADAQGPSAQARRRDHRHPHAARPTPTRACRPRARSAKRCRAPGAGPLAYIEEDVRAGAAGRDAAGVGYLLKDRVSDLERFAEAVRRVAEGGSALDPEVVSQMLGRRRVEDPLEELTPRERDVLALMAEGRSNQAIAEALVISGRAVEKHVTSIFTKLNLPPAPRTIAACWRCWLSCAASEHPDLDSLRKACKSPATNVAPGSRRVSAVTGQPAGGGA